MVDRTVDHAGNSDDNSHGGPLCTDRAELIERIKRGESPTWVPNPALRQEYLKANGLSITRSPPRELKPKPIPLLPPAEVGSIAKNERAQEQLHSPYEIERPRSALHAGDFTKETPESTKGLQRAWDTEASEPQWSSNAPPGSPSATSWYKPSSTHPVEVWEPGAPWALHHGASSDRRLPRDREPSISSLSASSYVLRAPTTPLVQQSNNPDMDLHSRNRSASPEKGNRRHTLPPHALHDWHAHSTSHHPTASPPSQFSRSFQREAGYPYPYHIRRSITSNLSLQPPSSPPTPAFLRFRRTSFSSEASPRQRASMVGSYEESILRGRMSTAPSKPFDFTAHIGALGKGKRPKMPAHVTVPFQAVFYDWSSNNHGKASNDEPSPYVGHIDLQRIERSASLQDLSHKDKEMSADLTSGVGENMSVDTEDPNPRFRKPTKRKRTNPSSVTPHGSYRVPEQGQIQVVVKNPYKTALKLFLVPYDLRGMEAGQKTFVRQRYYSTGPVIEKPLASDTLPLHVNPQGQKKPTLRYLIHLNICCPAKGQFYLYQHIRVVFANRVPDDKEYLTKEVQEPKPKYSPWKPNIDPLPSSNAGERLTGEKAFRRRSCGFPYGGKTTGTRHIQSYTGNSYPYADTNAPPVPPIPFHLPPPRRPIAQQYSEENGYGMDMASSRPTTSSDLTPPVSDETRPVRGHSSSHSGDDDGYTKLNRGDAGYGGIFGRSGTPELGEGLLAIRLRGLDKQKDLRMEDDGL